MNDPKEYFAVDEDSVLTCRFDWLLRALEAVANGNAVRAEAIMFQHAISPRGNRDAIMLRELLEPMLRAADRINRIA